MSLLVIESTLMYKSVAYEIYKLHTISICVASFSGYKIIERIDLFSGEFHL